MSESGSVRRFWGAVMMVVGVMIVGLCGLCSLAGVGLGMAYSEDLPSLLLMTIFAAAIPAVVGVGLVLWGRSVWRSGKRQRAG